MLASCSGLPVYTGDGQIANTTTWHDGLIRIPEYSIRLANFPLNENFEKEFNLGKLSFFKHTTVTVLVRFIDRHNWWLFGESDSSKTNKLILDNNWRELDNLKSHLTYHVVDESGKDLIKSDKLFKDYRWGQMQIKGGEKQIDVYNIDNVHTEIPGGEKLRLLFSYKGDTNMTNQAEIIIVCRSK